MPVLKFSNLGLTLLMLGASIGAGQELSNPGSKELCPCLSASELSADLQEQLIGWYLHDERDASLDSNVFESGCGLHHQAEAICRLNTTADELAKEGCEKQGLQYPFSALETTGSTCSQQDKHPKCNRQFCIVNSDTCKLDHFKFNVYANSTTLEGRLGVSYATCGYLDFLDGRKRQEDIVKGTQDRVLRVSLLDESAGWTGAYSSDNSHFAGPWQKWSGPTLSFIQKAALQGQFSLRIVNPNELFTDIKNDQEAFVQYYNGSQSPFDLCVYATAAGFVDLCIGDFTITDRRMFETNWLKLQTRYLHLAIPFTYGDESLIDDILTLFYPYQWQTWLFILGFVIPIMTILFFVFDDGKTTPLMKYEAVAVDMDKSENPKRYLELHDIPWYKRFARAISISYLSLATRSYSVDVASTPAKINYFGMSVFLFGFGLTYTANLAAQLTARHINVPVSSFEEALDRNYRFCTTRKKYDVVKSFHPNIPPERFAVDDVDGLPGFDNGSEEAQARELVLQRLNPSLADKDHRYCHAAILPKEDLEKMNSQSHYCHLMTVGPEVAAEALGLPVSRSNGHGMEHPYAFLQALEARGDFVKEMLGAHPPSRCSAAEKTNKETGFTIRQMGGIWVVSFGFSILAILVYIDQNCLCKSATIEPDEEGRVKQPAMDRNQWGSPINTIGPGISFIEWYGKPTEDGKFIMKSREVFEEGVAAKKASSHGRKDVELDLALTEEADTEG